MTGSGVQIDLTGQTALVTGASRGIGREIANRDRIRAMLRTLDARGHEVGILVNNAGIFRRAPATDHAAEDCDTEMAVNLDAPFLLARQLGRRMVERGRGKIVFIASVLSFQGGINVSGYAASKGAIAQFTRALANQWAAHRVNVNAVAPGYVDTDNTAALKPMASVVQP